MGTIPRFFNPKEPNYYDRDVHNYILSRGEDPGTYNKYAVVPKRLKDAYISVERMNTPPDPIDDTTKKLYVIAFDWCAREFSPVLSGSRIFSRDVVLEWLNPDKSPGLPWTQLYPTKGDLWLSPHADEYVKYWDVLATPDYIRSLCSLTIKEEVRSQEKIDVGSIRTTICMDCHHVMGHLMLYLDQNQRLVDTCGVRVFGCERHSSALGLNLLGGGADLMIRYMSKFGPKSVINLDGVRFDAKKKGAQFELLEDFRYSQLAEEFKTPQNKQRSVNIYKEIVHAPVVMPDGHVYKRDGSNPSGQGCTTPDNGFLNYTDMVVLYLLLVPPMLVIDGVETMMHNYATFKEVVRIIFCGDNINLSLHPAVQPYMTPAKIRAIAPKIFMEYTFQSESFQNAEDTEFLGHDFKAVRPPGLPFDMYVPTIDCERMRTNMLVDNKHGTIEFTIIRACGLRNETFGCESCREWFASLLNYLRTVTIKSQDPAVHLAWKNYLPDSSLWKLYTGRMCADARPYEPEKKAQSFVDQSPQSILEPSRPVAELAANLGSRIYCFESAVLLLSLSLLCCLLFLFTFCLSKMGKKTRKKRAKAKKKSAKKKVVSILSGKGDYTFTKHSMKKKGVGDLSDLFARKDLAGSDGESHGSRIGGTIGKIFGSEGIGKAIGNGAHSLLKYFTGVGDLHGHTWKQRNAAFNDHMKANPDSDLLATCPTFKKTGKSVVVSWQEEVAPILSSIGFQNTTYSLNPGLGPNEGGVYPWLRGVAQNFLRHNEVQQYFCVKPYVTEFNTAGSAGVCYTATVYNPLLLPFTTEQEIANCVNSSNGLLCEEHYHLTECANREKAVAIYDVRTEPTSDMITNDDLRFSDMGTLQVATVGSPVDGVRVATLFVTYTVEFFEPILPMASIITPTIFPFGHWQSQGNDGALGGAGVQSANVVWLHGILTDPNTNVLALPSNPVITGQANGTTVVTLDISACPPGVFEFEFDICSSFTPGLGVLASQFRSTDSTQSDQAISGGTTGPGVSVQFMYPLQPSVSYSAPTTYGDFLQQSSIITPTGYSTAVLQSSVTTMFKICVQVSTAPMPPGTNTVFLSVSNVTGNNATNYDCYFKTLYLAAPSLESRRPKSRYRIEPKALEVEADTARISRLESTISEMRKLIDESSRSGAGPKNSAEYRASVETMCNSMSELQRLVPPGESASSPPVKKRLTEPIIVSYEPLVEPVETDDSGVDIEECVNTSMPLSQPKLARTKK